jgi:hypothetical protein
MKLAKDENNRLFIVDNNKRYSKDTLVFFAVAGTILIVGIVIGLIIGIFLNPNL